MNTNIDVPDKALSYVLLQRTGYLAIPRTMVYRMLAKVWPWKLMNVVVPIEAALRKQRIRQLFNDDFAREFASIASALPRLCSAILDIGCGVGGIDVLLARYYADARPMFYLLDKTQVDPIHYGFEKRGAFYNSLDVAREVLMLNGVAGERIKLMHATDDNRIEMAGPVDLAISLISWGFHYPVETYLNRVHALLRPGGHLILDVRKSTGGEEAIRSKFPSVRPLQETEKYNRFLAVK